MFENAGNVILDEEQATILIVCEICGQSVSRQEYDRHLRTHKEKRVEVCNICFKSFTNISNFKYHLAHHGSERPWLCNECPKNYKTKIDLIQHQRVHDKARDPFQCSVCEAYFLTRSNLNTHMRTHSVKGPQKCEICDKIFVNLRSHIQMVHQKVRRHACQFCEKAFGKKSGLDRHIITVHEKKRCWSCDLCEKSFGEKAQLLRHRKIHFKTTAHVIKNESTEPPGEDEVVEGECKNNKQRMKCGICKRIVNSKAALKRHKLLIHLGQKNLLCDFCPRMFGERSNLKRHIEKAHKSETDLEALEAETEVHMDVKPLLYSCQSCDKMLTTKWGLDAHESACRLNQQRKLNNKYDSDEEYESQHVMEERLEETDGEDDEDTATETDNVEQIFLSPSIDDSIIKQEPEDDEGDYLDESIEAGSELIEVTIKEEPFEEMVTDEQQQPEELSVLKTEEETFVIQEVLEEPEKSQSQRSHPRMKSEDCLDPKARPALKCKFCAKTFKHLRYVIPHYNSVHEVKKVECKIAGCNETFIHRTQRMRHQQKVHPETYEESDDANSDVDYEPIVEEYLEDDEGVMPGIGVTYECIMCPSEFETQDQLDVHFESAHDEGDVEDEQLCTACDPPRSFKNNRALYRHTKALHSGLVFSCPECDRQFSFKRSLDRHVKGVHQDIKDCSCDIEDCDEKFRCSYDLKQHKINAHDIGDKADRTCTICNSVFKKVRYLETHMLAKHSSASFQCGLCDRSFSFERSLRRHIRGVHEDIKDHECEACSMKYRTAHDLKQHMINEHNAGDKSDRTCTVCQPNKVFKKEKYLQMHMSSIHNEQAPLFLCPICNRGFSFQRSMERHIRGIHENRRDFQCESEGCNKSFRSRYELNEHVNNIHTEESEKKRSSLDKVTCDICDKVCKTPKILYCHKKIVHEGKKWGTGKVSCKVCKEQFDSKYWKNKHWAQVHRNGEVINRVCRLCNSEFQFFEDFKDHVDSHVGHFICMICGQDFHDEMSLTTHGESHRRYEDEFRPFICDVCSHRLTTKAQLAIHMRKHFGGHHYICDVCGKTYKFIAPFLHHKKTHLNKYDFQCRFCEKKFIMNRDRTLHERVHTKERPYGCEQCGRAFSYKAALNKHTKTHDLNAFMCKVCGLQNSTGPALRQHEELEHPELLPFSCCYCRKSFKVDYSLEAHKLKCTEAMNFPAS